MPMSSTGLLDNLQHSNYISLFSIIGGKIRLRPPKRVRLGGILKLYLGCFDKTITIDCVRCSRSDLKHNTTIQEGIYCLLVAGSGNLQKILIPIDVLKSLKCVLQTWSIKQLSFSCRTKDWVREWHARHSELAMNAGKKLIDAIIFQL